MLDGRVAIGDEGQPAVLTIESGTKVIGSSADDFLIIQRGSRIEANGTAQAPIDFTALAEIQGTLVPSSRGLWGGLVINGFAPINDCPQGASGGSAACVKEGEANSGLFGGDRPNDNSGTLRYVRVKFAGSNVDPRNQLNGIAFQGVGKQTLIEFIQVHNNLDDGVEFFGGTADARYVVLTGHGDDSLDWTDGWTGRMQFVHIEQARDSGDNGIEADNRAGDESAEPCSAPSIANLSIIGNPNERAVRLRRGTGLRLYNALLSGSKTCLRVQGDSLNRLGTDILFDGVRLNCATNVEGDDVNAIQTFLDGGNVSETAAAPTAATLPSDGFFKPSSRIGSDIGSWGAGWVEFITLP